MDEELRQVTKFMLTVLAALGLSLLVFVVVTALSYAVNRLNAWECQNSGGEWVPACNDMFPVCKRYGCRAKP